MYLPVPGFDPTSSALLGEVARDTKATHAIL